MKNKKETLAIILMLIILGVFVFTACEDPCDHVWDITAATCERRQECQLCGTKSKLGPHAYGEWQDVVSISGEPEKQTKVCSICGDVVTQYIPTPNLGFTLINNNREYSASMGNASSIIIVIPEEYEGKPVTAIALEGFFNISITKVYIPDSVTTINSKAFQNCTSLTDIVFVNNSKLTTIGDRVFDGCSNLTSISIPDSVINIGEYAFRNCESLTNVEIPNKITTISEGLFTLCDNLASITLPNSITNIGVSAFHDCTNLTTVIIPNGVTSIGVNAFKGCINLDISIPISVNTIGSGAFHGWGGGQKIKIPYSRLNGVPSGWTGWRDNCGAVILNNSGVQVFP